MGDILVKDRANKIDIVDICRLLRDDKVKDIVVMTGPGINQPPEREVDFEFNEEGFFGLVEPFFDLEGDGVDELLAGDGFSEDPRTFFTILGEVFYLSVKYADISTAHKFLKVLDNNKMLRRVYTSNVDSGERRTGLSKDKVVEAYGTLRTSHCEKCNKEYNFKWLAKFMKKGNFDPEKGDVTIPKCTKCKTGVIRPDIVMYGDKLKDDFYRMRVEDMANCDLLIILGTRLREAPFRDLIKMTREDVPRFYVNNVRPASDAALNGEWLMCGGNRQMLGRDSDVVVQLFRVDQTIGDVCDLVKWTERLKKVKERRIKKIK